MIALDTNVIVRLVTADDSGQLKAARAVFAAGDLWVPKTVLLETEWVLRYSYERKPPAIREIFRKLLGYPQLQVEDRSAVLRALTLYEQGLDFADALHLASSGDADRVCHVRSAAREENARLGGEPRRRAATLIGSIPGFLSLNTWVDLRRRPSAPAPA